MFYHGTVRGTTVQLAPGGKSTREFHSTEQALQRKNKVKETAGLSFVFMLNLAYSPSIADSQKSFLLEKFGNQNKQT